MPDRALGQRRPLEEQWPDTVGRQRVEHGNDLRAPCQLSRHVVPRLTRERFANRERPLRIVGKRAHAFVDESGEILVGAGAHEVVRRSIERGEATSSPRRIRANSGTDAAADSQEARPERTVKSPRSSSAPMTTAPPLSTQACASMGPQPGRDARRQRWPTACRGVSASRLSRALGQGRCARTESGWQPP